MGDFPSFNLNEAQMKLQVDIAASKIDKRMREERKKLRDELALSAMNALIIAFDGQKTDIVVTKAYKIADAMLIERGKKYANLLRNRVSKDRHSQLLRVGSEPMG
jgi:hypothetical protein